MKKLNEEQKDNIQLEILKLRLIFLSQIANIDAIKITMKTATKTTFLNLISNASPFKSLFIPKHPQHLILIYSHLSYPSLKNHTFVITFYILYQNYNLN